MKSILESTPVKKLANIPVLWNFAQNLIGARAWKDEIYPSVFERTQGTFLDFGCSSGNETGMFLDFDYYGVDIDKEAISAASEKFTEHEHVQFFAVNIIKDGFKKDFFDHVLFAGTAHHLRDEDLDAILDILVTNLKPGGQLHFFEPISQPEQDSKMTRFIIRSDQGKHTRTEATYKELFAKKGLHASEWKIFRSPDRFIKFPDFLYVRIIK